MFQKNTTNIMRTNPMQMPITMVFSVLGSISHLSLVHELPSSHPVRSEEHTSELQSP